MREQRNSHLKIMILTVATLVFVNGCVPWFSDKKEEFPEGVGMISIHPYYPQGGADEQTIVDYHVSGKPVHMGMKPVLTSAFIDAINIIPTEQGNALEIMLSVQGKNRWSEATSQYFGHAMALVVDERFRCLISIPKASDTGHFVLPGPFTDAEAKRMADFVNNRDK